jgi:hypothetical protein
MSSRTSQSDIALPVGGRLCQRNLSHGHVWVGVLHLPEDFVPVEGVAYALFQNEDQLVLVREPASGPLKHEHLSYGVGNLLTSQIWNETLDSNALVVRFLQAFPEDNVWGVYGASQFNLDDAPTHTWCDVSAKGKLSEIDPPMEARGEGIGSLLSAHPVWPNKQGELYTLSQLQTPYRAHFHTYHKMLIKAAGDDEYRKNLRKTLAQDPDLCHLNGSIDEQFCEYLVALDKRGLVQPDAPQSAADFEKRQQASKEIIRTVMFAEDVEDAPEAAVASARRPRP